LIFRGLIEARPPSHCRQHRDGRAEVEDQHVVVAAVIAQPSARQLGALPGGQPALNTESCSQGP
jgi:hypothetical protein